MPQIFLWHFCLYINTRLRLQIESRVVDIVFIETQNINYQS